MTPGKAQAHSGHAANAFVNEILTLKHHHTPEIEKGYLIWSSSTSQGFGTQINLKAQTDEELADWIDTAKMAGYLASLIWDPTYPYMVTKEIYDLIDPMLHSLPSKFIPESNMYLCYRKEWTAGYVFDHGERPGEIKEINKNLILHP